MAEQENEVLDPRTLSGGPQDGGFYLTKSTAQVDAEDREAEASGDTSDAQAQATALGAATRDFATEDTDKSAYVGVSPEYMTHAGVQNQPFAAEGGAEQEREDRILGRAAGAVGADGPHEGQQTQGGGSAPTVYAATSGDNVQPEEVDRAKVHSRSVAKKESQAKAEHRPPPRSTSAAADSGKTE